MPFKHQQVIAANSDGLGNRIKCIVSAYLREPNNARIFWPINTHVDCEFNTLFKNRNMLINDIPSGAKILTSWRFTGIPSNTCYDNFNEEEKIIIDFEYNRIPKYIKELLLPIFKLLKPSNVVLSQVQRTRNKFNSKTISVHVRSWIDSPEREYKFSIYEYYKIMDKFPEYNFYIASDSKKVINLLRNRYPGRIIVHDLTNYEIKHGNKYQQALAEMLLLSANKSLIASYGSTFSEVAWWFGGASAEVHVVPLRKFTGDIYDINYAYLFAYKLIKQFRRLIGQ